jgi:hypothetical protein
MEKTLRSSPALCGGIAQMRLDVTLGLQAIERGIDCAYRHLTASAGLDFLPDSNPVGPITKTQKRQNDDVFKFTEIITARHYLYNIEEIPDIGNEFRR